MDRFHHYTYFLQKPVKKPYSRNKDFRGHAFKRVPKLLNLSSERTCRVRPRFFSNRESTPNVLINIQSDLSNSNLYNTNSRIIRSFYGSLDN